LTGLQEGRRNLLNGPNEDAKGHKSCTLNGNLEIKLSGKGERKRRRSWEGKRGVGKRKARAFVQREGKRNLSSQSPRVKGEV
jgi:hypothetical protein